MFKKHRQTKRRHSLQSIPPAIEFCEQRTLLAAAGLLPPMAGPPAPPDINAGPQGNGGHSGGSTGQGQMMGPQQLPMRPQLPMGQQQSMSPPPVQPPQNGGPQITIPTEVRSLDGTGNNPSDSELGSSAEPLLRVAPAEYADGISAPAGGDRPSAREISNAVSDHVADPVLSEQNLSAMLYVWGQFVDHDIDLTLTQDNSGESLPIAVPIGDPYFDPTGTGTQIIPMTRSAFDTSTGDSVDNPRQQTSQVTAWLDGSVVYGSDAATLAGLRAYEGGRMLLSDDGLLPTDATGHFMAGDIRAEDNPLLTSMQTLFVREHNYWAGQIAAANPGLSDEDVFQAARSRVIAEMQAVTYNEFLPALLGRGAIPTYQGYDPTVNPTIANEFSTAAYRFGHSTIEEDIEFFGNDGTPVAEEIPLREAFFNPSILMENGIDSALKYAASSVMEEVDLQVVDSLRNFLFGEPGQGGFDLVSLNIQRGRDHGLADYNAVRVAYGLDPVTSFDQITSDPELAAKLEALYGSVDNVDVWVGGLAEDHVAGSSMGQLFQTIIADQFTRLRDGDRFFYQNVYSGGELQSIQQTSLADIIERNSVITNLQHDVFHMNASVSGQVFADLNGNGRLNPRDKGLRGIQVQLLNAEGDLVATTRTDAHGRYRFDEIYETGQYQIRISETAGSRVTTATTVDVLVSRGGVNLRHLNFGLQPLRRRR
ncbi:peroxidase [bacterium]|nr:peroxidase [bacterium]